MKKPGLGSSVRIGYAIALLSLSLQGCSAPEDPQRPPVAPEPAPATPPVARIFAPGTVSTSAPEFATSVTADGKEVYFNRTADDRSSLAIMSSRWVDGAWTEAQVVSFSGEYFDVDPFASFDGSQLFFSSSRPHPAPQADGGDADQVAEQEAGDFDLWVVARDNEGTWGEPKNLGPTVNSDASDIYSTVARNGNLYFSSEREGERAFYVSRWTDGEYAEPERLALGGRNAGDEDAARVGNPAIAPDESFLVFAQHGLDRDSAADLYVSFRSGDAWSEPRNLGELVNSPFADFAPSISPDGAYLYWTSERPGIVAETPEGRPPGDLYVIEWAAVAE